MSAKTSLSYNNRRAKRKALDSLGVAEKRPTAGHNVSHAMNKTKRLFKPNLQKTRVLVDGKLISVRIDAKTIRNLTKATKERVYVDRKKTAKPASSRSEKKPAAKK